ncbi:hypothetical protein [Verrucomicrobium spinosum]|uniref:hypothetical protein n=1 Tax=Verrucomicrobium spinosum TaxID=2736 RepID=UPI0009468591|nr:hypothetical protein [Verrucomicrobium spinosum]
MDFAGEAVTRGAQIRAGSGTQYAGPRGATRLKSAASYTLAQIPESRASRLLVLTDGFSTEPLDGLAERLREQRVPLDYRLAAQSTVGDWRIAALALPRRVQLREAFLAEVVVLGDRDGKIPVELTRNNQSIGRREVEVINGVGRLRFTDRLGVAGAFHYEARLMAADDAVAGNNAASQWVEVQGGPRVVLATAYENDPLAQALRPRGSRLKPSPIWACSMWARSPGPRWWCSTTCPPTAWILGSPRPWISLSTIRAAVWRWSAASTASPRVAILDPRWSRCCR